MAWQNLDLTATGATSGNFDTDTAGQTNSFWLPEIYSKKVQIAFRKSSVCRAITNTDYMGEISSFGDTVNIIKEPSITVSTYYRSLADLTATVLSDQELILTIDQANYFEFQIDDLEKRFSHVNWQSLAADNAGYQLKDTMDAEIISTMVSGASSSSPDHVLGADGSGTAVALATNDGTVPLATGHGTNDTDPLDVMARMARLLDEQNVPSDNRWFLASPAWYEDLALTSSKLLSTDYNSGASSLRNGLVVSGKVRGFELYVTNNMPSTSYATSVIMAGHRSAVASADALLKTETLRSTATFRDIVRGLHVYGRKVLRSNALVVGYWS